MSLMCIWIRVWSGFGTFFLSDQDLLLKIRKSDFLSWANISFFVKKFCFKSWWYYNMVNLSVMNLDSLGSASFLRIRIRIHLSKYKAKIYFFHKISARLIN